MDTEQAEQGGKGVVRGVCRAQDRVRTLQQDRKELREMRSTESGRRGVREDTGESDIRRGLGAHRGGL